MTFGKIMKDLRRNANMTQEKLAEILNISPQAVSRWETDAAVPDISLLPPIANLFHVTTDYLLCMDTYQKDLRKAEFEKAFPWSRDLEQEEFQEVMNQMRNSSYNKSVVRQNYIAASQKDRQEIAEAVKKTEKGDDS